MQTLNSRAAIARVPIRSAATVAAPRGRSALVVSAHKVTIKHEGKETVLEVGEDETLLEACVNEGIEVPHDCDMGVCMTCPSRLTSGTVDHGSCVLSDDVMEAGYCLMCVATPTSDCVIETIEEEELLDLQLCA